MKENSKCSCGCNNDNEKTSGIMPNQEVLYNTAELLKVFGDPTRIGIISVLVNGEKCVCDIASVLEMSPSAISHHLRVLKQTRLVKAKRSGKTIFYSLCDDHVQKIFYCAMEHVMEHKHDVL